MMRTGDIQSAPSPRRLVQGDEAGLFAARETGLPLLRYYANAIAHLLEQVDPLAGNRSASQEKHSSGPA